MSNLKDFIPTRGSILKSPQEYKSISYKSYKPKEKTTNVFLKKEETKNVNEFNIRKAKHEVVKFGMSGFNSKRKEEAKIQLAVKLGAKPPKNKNKNYKVLLAERSKEKAKAERIATFQQLGKNCLGKSVAKGKSFDRKRKKEKQNGILDIYGKVKINAS